MGNKSSNIRNSDFSEINSQNNIYMKDNSRDNNNNNNNFINSNINNQVKQYLSKLENSYEYNYNNDSNSNSSSIYNSFESHKSKKSTNSYSSNVTVLSILQSSQFMYESSSNNITQSNNNIHCNNNEEEVPLYISKTLHNYATSKIWCGTFENKECIIKGIKKSNQRSRNLFRSEKNALLKLNHPNIVKCFGVTKDSKYYYLILQKGITDLADFRMNYKMNEKHCAIVIKKVLQAVKYCHKRNIVHRDLKPENILFKSNNYNNPIIIDFGESLIIKDSQIYDNILVGTPNYLSPERILFDQITGEMYKKSDIWSCGIICYELITGKHCFNGKNNNSIYNKIMDNYWNWPTKCNASHICRNFVAECLVYDSFKRINITKALQHQYICEE